MKLKTKFVEENKKPKKRYRVLIVVGNKLSTIRAEMTWWLWIKTKNYPKTINDSGQLNYFIEL
jgi:hypothetical protein